MADFHRVTDGRCAPGAPVESDCHATSLRTRMKILIIEPCYFGVGYVETARKLGLECLVATSDPSFPDQHRYREWASRILVCSVTDELAIKRTLEEAKQLSSIGAVV